MSGKPIKSPRVSVLILGKEPESFEPWQPDGETSVSSRGAGEVSRPSVLRRNLRNRGDRYYVQLGDQKERG